MRLLVGALVIFSVACGPPKAAEPAPDGLGPNLRWFWSTSDESDDATVLDATAKLSSAGKISTRTSAFKGAQSERLSASDLKVVNLESNDPSKARGLMVVNLFDCKLDVLADILSADDQIALYPDSWTTHARTANGDRQAFLEKRTNRYGWDADITVTFPVGDVYQSKLKGSLRRVPASSTFEHDVLVARLWLTAPATFASSSTSYFNQNYEIEVFWEHSPGRIAHGYGMWREVKVGTFNITIEQEDLLKITLDNLVDWDTKTQALCAKR